MPAVGSSLLPPARAAGARAACRRRGRAVVRRSAAPGRVRAGRETWGVVRALRRDGRVRRDERRFGPPAAGRGGSALDRSAVPAPANWEAAGLRDAARLDWPAWPDAACPASPPDPDAAAPPGAPPAGPLKDARFRRQPARREPAAPRAEPDESLHPAADAAVQRSDAGARWAPPGMAGAARKESVPVWDRWRPAWWATVWAREASGGRV